MTRETSRLNQAVFTRPDSVALYADEEGLVPAEQAALARVRLDRGGRGLGRVLDIGVGGGRTAGALSAEAERYLGVDYVPAMVAAARRRHPTLTFETADVRAMPQLADGAFDLALFSFNGLDALDHEGRLQALAEIRRVLAPGGHFVFSAHNRLTPLPSAWRRDDLPWTRAHLAASLATAASGVLSHLRLRRRQRRTPDYALVNDRAHNHRMLVYYITPDRQRAQLEQAGFVCLETIDLSGHAVPADGTPSRDPWLHYCCRKA